MTTATLPPVDGAVPALAQAERLAWLFRSVRPDELPHPLRQPLACLRDAADVDALATAMSVPVPWLVAHQPRYTIDRTWLQQQAAAYVGAAGEVVVK